MRGFKDFDTMEKELGEKRGVISALDFANEAVAITTAAIDVMSLTQSRGLATAAAAMKTSEALSKLFPEEPQEEKEDKAAEEPQEERNTEKDAKYDDLKHRLFKYAAIWSFPFQTVIEDQRTAEVRRSAKQMTLLSLISEAGLTDEYHEWLRENGYE